MNAISAILRLLSGLILVVLAGTTYAKNTRHIAAGDPMHLFGVPTGLSSGQVTAALVAVGLIGLGLVILGVVTLCKGRR